jgi:orotate phosphoribosyltransferase
MVGRGTAEDEGGGREGRGRVERRVVLTDDNPTGGAAANEVLERVNRPSSEHEGGPAEWRALDVK